MVSSRNVALIGCVLLSLILIYSCGQMLAVSAEAPKTYRLGVGAGDWAEYNVDELNGWASSFIKPGDRLRYEVVSILNASASQNGTLAFFFEVANMKMFINGVEQEYTYFAMTLLLGIAPMNLVSRAPSMSRCPWAQYVVDSMWGNPFYPAGNEFWSDVAANYPKLRLSYGVGTITTTGCDLANFTCSTSVTIDVATGIMLQFEARMPSNQSDAIVMHLIDTSNLGLSSYLSESRILIVALALSMAGVIVGVMVYASRRLEAQ
jgi:hypothetical protein